MLAKYMKHKFHSHYGAVQPSANGLFDFHLTLYRAIHASTQSRSVLNNINWDPTWKVATVIVGVASEGLGDASGGVALELVVPASLRPARRDYTSAKDLRDGRFASRSTENFLTGLVQFCSSSELSKQSSSPSQTQVWGGYYGLS